MVQFFKDQFDRGKYIYSLVSSIDSSRLFLISNFLTQELM